MRVPAWVYVIGIIMTLFGGCGVIGNISTIAFSNPETQKSLVESMEKLNKSGSSDFDSEEFNKVLEESQTPYTKVKIYFELLFSMLYAVAGIFLLIKNKNAIKLCYLALSVSILSSLADFIYYMAFSDSLFMKFGSFFTWIPIVINFILLIIVATVDKTQWKYLTGEFKWEDPDQGHSQLV